MFLPYQDKSYGMSLPRLGNGIIINNVSRSAPGSEADVKRLKETHETVGFDVFTYRDPTAEVRKYVDQFILRFVHTTAATTR